MSPLDDFFPVADLQTLRIRARLLAKIRDFFSAKGFLEVETPILSGDVVVDRHIDPFTTCWCPDPRRPETGQTLYLQTSPEFCMKRLIAAGAEAIYQITHAFRNGAERGRMHNPEFTIVEWYRAGDGMRQGMQTLSDLCQSILDSAPAERISYRNAFLRHAGAEPHTASIGELIAVAARRNISVPPGLASDRDVLLQLLLSELVEPHLGTKAPAILFDYPASQAALAQVRNEEYPVAERFELYINGVELANGYHELLDYEVLRQRNAEVNQERIADGKPALPNESRLLAAMKHGLPACCGTALGFDRLAMIASGAATIDQVLAFAIERA